MRFASRALVSAFAVVPMLAMAEDKVEQPKDAINLKARVMLDAWAKDFNVKDNNLKQPRLNKFRLKAIRETDNTTAMLELQFQRFERADAVTPAGTVSGTTFTGTSGSIGVKNVIRRYDLMWKTPVENLSIGWVRNDPNQLGAYLDAGGAMDVAATNSATTFSGFGNTIEGARVKYTVGGVELNYYVARDSAWKPSKNIGSNNEAINDNYGWYHNIGAETTVADTKVTAVVAVQNRFLDEKDAAGVTSGKAGMLLDGFVQGEYTGVANLKVKAGVGYTKAPATKKNDDNSVTLGSSSFTTILVGTKYSVMPKTLDVIADVGYRTTKFSDKIQKDYSCTVAGAETCMKDSMSEMGFNVGAQYWLDTKLSLVPTFGWYSNPLKAQNNIGQDETLFAKRNALTKNAGEAANSQMVAGLAVRFDY